MGEEIIKDIYIPYDNSSYIFYDYIKNINILLVFYSDLTIIIINFVFYHYPWDNKNRNLFERIIDLICNGFLKVHYSKGDVVGTIDFI